MCIRDSGEPYPLLVVRPGGERLYLACRRAMKAWDNEFGYELVEADIELAYPEKDPSLETIITDTRNLARQQQAQMLRMIAAMQPDDGPTYRADHSGGFVIDGQPSRPRRGRLRGGSGLEGGDGSGSRTQPGKGNSKFANGADFVLANGQPGSGRGVGPNTETTGTFGGGGDFQAGTDGQGSQFDSGQLGSGKFGAAPSGSGQLGSGQFERGQSASNGQALNGQYNADQTGDYANAGASGDSSQNDGQAFAQGQFDGQASFGSSGGSQAGEPQANFEMPQFASQGQSAPNGQFAPNGQSSSGSFDGANISQNSLTYSGGTPGNPQNGQASSQQGPGASSSGQSASSSGSPGGSASSTASAQPSQRASVSIAQHRGKDWALPNAVQGAIPAERPLFIALNNAQLVLEAEPGTRQIPAVVTFQNGSSAAVQSLVTTIWKRIKTWGVAGPGVYWRPKLRFDVAPDAQATFDEIAVLLEGSGLEVQRN